MRLQVEGRPERERLITSMSKNNYLNSIPTVIDLFCGCGGLSLGFEKAGFSIAAALDSDPQSIKTYEDNRLWLRLFHIV